jgi:hypothetical protein
MTLDGLFSAAQQLGLFGNGGSTPTLPDGLQHLLTGSQSDHTCTDGCADGNHVMEVALPEHLLDHAPQLLKTLPHLSPEIVQLLTRLALGVLGQGNQSDLLSRLTKAATALVGDQPPSPRQNSQEPTGPTGWGGC